MQFRTTERQTGGTVVVRYVGPRVGSIVYPVGANRYKFGQSAQDRVRFVNGADAQSLVAGHPLEFLIIPNGMFGVPMALETRILLAANVPHLSQAVKLALGENGLSTIGQIIALSEETLSSYTGLSAGQVREMQNEIKGRFGLPVVPMAHPVAQTVVQQDVQQGDADDDDLTILRHVGQATARRLNAMGYNTFDSVANKLTIDQWLSIRRTSADDFDDVVAHAKEILSEQ